MVKWHTASNSMLVGWRPYGHPVRTCYAESSGYSTWRDLRLMSEMRQIVGN